MKKILFFSGFFFIALMLSDLAVATMLDYCYIHSLTGPYGGMINAYIRKTPKPDLLIMGSSRAYRHIDPKILPISAVNLAMDSKGIRYQLLLLKILLQEGVIPRNILLHIDEDNFAFLERRDYHPSGLNGLSYYYWRNADVRQALDALGPFEHWKYLFRTYRYNGFALGVVRNYVNTMQGKINAENGFGGITPTSRDSLNALYDVGLFVKKRFSDRSFLHPEPFGDLRQFIQICRSKGIRLIAIASPVLDERCRVAPAARNQIISFIEQQGVPFLGFSVDRIPELKSPSLWEDSRHLNANGAAIFSKKLGEALIPYLN